jgi:hypothetical protein
MTPRGRARLAALVLAGVALAPAGCGGDGDGDSAETVGGAAPVESVTERGPVRLRVDARPAAVTVGERVTLTVEVVAANGIEVVMPRLEDALGDFAVREGRVAPDVPDGDRRRWTGTYDLDTFTAGDVEIPPISVSFTDARPEALTATGEAVDGVMESEPLVVTVRSVLTGTEGEGDFRDIKEAVTVPLDAATLRRRWLTAGAVVLALGAAAAVVAVLVIRRVRRGPPPSPPIPADVWALAELDRLAADRLIERGAFHDFHFRLTDVLRSYLERRFGLRAPERTTEEFLRDAGRSRALSGEHRELLAGFLRAADMIKFALHEPSPDESRSAFDRARAFVEQTRPGVAREAAA